MLEKRNHWSRVFQYLSELGSEQRGLQQPVQDSLEAAQGWHSWLARLQLESQGCHISAAAVSRCRQLRRHPSSPQESLCWHGLTGPWQGSVAALGRWRTIHLTIDKLTHRSPFKMTRPCYTTLTRFQVPEVFTTDLVVPSFTITVPAAPYIQPRIDGHSTVASTSPRDVVFKRIHQHRLPTHAVYRHTRGTNINSSEGRFTQTSSKWN